MLTFIYTGNAWKTLKLWIISYFFLEMSSTPPPLPQHTHTFNVTPHNNELNELTLHHLSSLWFPENLKTWSPSDFAFSAFLSLKVSLQQYHHFLSQHPLKRSSLQINILLMPVRAVISKFWEYLYRKSQ